MAFRPFASLVAFLPLSLLACGGGGGQAPPSGMHYHYVANQVNVPTNNNQARQWGLDLTGAGTVDNQLGMVLGTLSSMGFDIQGNINKAVAEGSINLLLDFQTKDFMNTTGAGIEVFLGTNPQPPACNPGNPPETPTCTGGPPELCTGCAHQLSGSAMFSLSTTATAAGQIAGKIVAGTFTGGSASDTLALSIALGGTQAIELDLIGAHAKASNISPTAMGMTSGATSTGGAILGGALTQDDLNNKVIPAIQQQLVPIIERDCCGPGNTNGHTDCTGGTAATPYCYCTSGPTAQCPTCSSTGKTILGLFDTTPKDCTVSVSEIQNNSLIMSLLAPDVTIGGKPALSLGINVTAVGATFTPPGQ